MSKGAGVFSPRERRTALIALLAAGAITAGGMLLHPLLKPSVGPGGADAYLTTTTPGVLDATPFTG